MDPLKLKELIEEAVKSSIDDRWWVLVATIILAGVLGYIGSYLREKGKNLATREEVQGITQKIEEVKKEYNKQLEAYKSSLQLSNQLKVAALDKRLQKHQEAYSLWLKLLFSLRNPEELGKVIDECQSWWNENCLYLGEDARYAYKFAYIVAGDFINISGMSTSESRERLKDIEEAGIKLVESVNLPSLGDNEIRPKTIEEGETQ